MVLLFKKKNNQPTVLTSLTSPHPYSPQRLTESALEAYCCGWTEDDARREITRASARVDGAPRVEASAALVALVWLTAEAAKDVTRAADVAVRWSKGEVGRWWWEKQRGGKKKKHNLASHPHTPTSPAPAVSPATTATWSGFVSLIVGAALGERRWAWYPLDRLATELALASDAPPPPPADVAELARVVYATLDAVTASSAAQKKRGRRRGEGEGGSWAR